MDFWLSYDLGIKGDYEGLFRWLDTNKAIDCGDSFALVKDYYFEGDFISYLTDDLSKNVSFEKKHRIYVVFLSPEKKARGKFIFGSRKNSPEWAGFGSSQLNLEDLVG